MFPIFSTQLWQSAQFCRSESSSLSSSTRRPIHLRVHASPDAWSRMLLSPGAELSLRPSSPLVNSQIISTAPIQSFSRPGLLLGPLTLPVILLSQESHAVFSFVVVFFLFTKIHGSFIMSCIVLFPLSPTQIINILFISLYKVQKRDPMGALRDTDRRERFAEPLSSV